MQSICGPSDATSWKVSSAPGPSLDPLSTVYVTPRSRRLPGARVPEPQKMPECQAFCPLGAWAVGPGSRIPLREMQGQRAGPPSPGPPAALAPSLLGAPSSLLSIPPFRGCHLLGGGRCEQRRRVLLSRAHVCVQARRLLCTLPCPLREVCVCGGRGGGGAGRREGLRLFYFYPPVAVGRSFHSFPSTCPLQSAVNRKGRPSHPRRPRKVSVHRPGSGAGAPDSGASEASDGEEDGLACATGFVGGRS